MLTPFYGDISILKETVSAVGRQLEPGDWWVIVLDHPKERILKELEIATANLVILENTLKRGAGNSRNVGLDYIAQNINAPMILYPFDGDDNIVSGGVRLIKNVFETTDAKLVSFGHTKVFPNGTKAVVSYSGIFQLKDLLKNYNTPCGSTALRVDSANMLTKLRFGKRLRANDQLFFLGAASYFGGYQCFPQSLLIYKVGNPVTLSGKKFKMPFYKFLSLLDFGIGPFKAFYYMIYYIVFGIRRYFFKQNI